MHILLKIRHGSLKRAAENVSNSGELPETDFRSSFLLNLADSEGNFDKLFNRFVLKPESGRTIPYT